MNGEQSRSGEPTGGLRAPCLIVEMGPVLLRECEQSVSAYFAGLPTVPGRDFLCPN